MPIAINPRTHFARTSDDWLTDRSIDFPAGFHPTSKTGAGIVHSKRFAFGALQSNDDDDMAPFNTHNPIMPTPRRGRRREERPPLPSSALLLLFLVLAAAIPAVVVQGRLEFAKSLGDHMVLQRAPHRAAIYGHADPHVRIAVTLKREPAVSESCCAACIWIGGVESVYISGCGGCCRGDRVGLIELNQSINQSNRSFKNPYTEGDYAHDRGRRRGGGGRRGGNCWRGRVRADIPHGVERGGEVLSAAGPRDRQRAPWALHGTCVGGVLGMPSGIER